MQGFCQKLSVADRFHFELLFICNDLSLTSNLTHTVQWLTQVTQQIR